MIFGEKKNGHFGLCPMSQEGKHTLCVCPQIEKADAAAKKEAALEDAECMRCHNLAADCHCGPKAQLV